MSKDTSIQWCDSSVNPVMGCDGCEIWGAHRQTCYAGVLHRRYGSQKGYASVFEKPEMFPGRMAKAAKWGYLQFKDRPEKPWLNRLPRLIFVSDMGDALSESIPFEYLLEEIVRVAKSIDGRRHHWLWLTKRPKRMLEFSRWLEERGESWPLNLWPMTSVTGRATQRRASILRQIGPPELIRGISFEPLYDEPVWDYCLMPLATGENGEEEPLHRISWAIFGGESGADARSLDVDAMMRGVAACREHGVAPFIKQLGAKPTNITLGGRVLDTHGGDWSKWPQGMRVREMPAMPML